MKESRLCRACEIQANDEQVKQMPMHTCGKDGPIERAEPKDQSTPIAMEPTKERITPEQFYSESKWPEMKDKFDKSAFKFSHDDLCQFANDYAQQELFNSLPMTDKKQLYKDAEDYARQLGVDIDKEFRSDVELAYVDGATAEHERAQQELQAYRDIIKELIPIASKARGLEFPGDEFVKAVQTLEKARKLIDTVTPT